MGNNDKPYVKTHHVLGIVLGILGIIAALLLTFIGGVVGGGIALILGLAALLIGISARKGGKGWGAIIAGVLAVILAVSMTVSANNAFTLLRDKAKEYGDQAPMLQKYLDKPYLGMLGIIVEAAKSNEADLQALSAEIDLLNKNVDLTVQTNP